MAVLGLKGKTKRRVTERVLAFKKKKEVAHKKRSMHKNGFVLSQVASVR